MPVNTLAAQNPIPAWFNSSHLKGMLRGIERETLRMQSNGFLSQQPHPQALGSALTHPHITTDYSEALLEFITAPHDSIDATLAQLTQIHQYVQQHLPEGERIWPLSMPCMLDADEQQIPLAQYGHSNIGRLKTLYRHGLGLRYGRRMQTIAGVHYNLSFSDDLFAQLQAHESDLSLQQLSLQDYRSHRYFGLIRNFLRISPLLMLVLGASPTVCACFLTGREHHLMPLLPGTLYLPDATALRMGRLGYQNSAQKQLGIHYNTLGGYVAGLQRAVKTQYKAFSKLGLDDANGQPIQINDHILQIENEYYSIIRPKQIPVSGETPVQALAKRGVAYVELRAVDVDPYSPIGIAANSAAFLECLALYCLLQDSPELLDAEQARIDSNQTEVVNRGRASDAVVQGLTEHVALRPWVLAHLNAMQDCARCLDETRCDGLYSSALAEMVMRVQQVEQSLSAQVIQDTVAQGGTWSLGRHLADQHAEYFAQMPLEPAVQAHFEQLAAASVADQQRLEQDCQQRFQDYVAQYRST